MTMQISPGIASNQFAGDTSLRAGPITVGRLIGFTLEYDAEILRVFESCQACNLTKIQIRFNQQHTLD